MARKRTTAAISRMPVSSAGSWSRIVLNPTPAASTISITTPPSLRNERGPLVRMLRETSLHAGHLENPDTGHRWREAEN